MNKLQRLFDAKLCLYSTYGHSNTLSGSEVKKTITSLLLLLFLGYITPILATCTMSSGGKIGNPQSNCGTYSPSAITNVSGPSSPYGGSYTYKWQKTTDPNTAAGNASNYYTITGANGSTYDPGTISVTSWYRRCAARSECGDFPSSGYSNWVKMTVDQAPDMVCEGWIDGAYSVLSNCEISICQGRHLRLSVNPNVSTVNWTGPNGFTANGTNDITLGNATPAMSGQYTATLTQNGCTATKTITVHVNATPNAGISGNLGVCNGQTTTLNANGDGSATWSNGSTAYSINVGAGTYSVTFSNYGCTATATVTNLGSTVGGTVSPAEGSACGTGPSVPTPSFSVSGIVGTVARWEYLPPGGGWTNWGGAGSNTSPGGWFSSVGQWRFRAIISGPCGEAASSEAVWHVNALPGAAISGNLSVCNGQTTTLIANGDGSATWSNGSTAYAINVGAGTYSVTFSNYGCTTTATATVTNLGSTVGGTVSPAEGSVCGTGPSVPTPSFSVSGIVGTVARWEYLSPGGGWTNWGGAGSNTSPGGWFSSVGQWKFRAIISGPCGEAASSEAVWHVNALPGAAISGNLSVCNGQTTTLTANGNGSATWSNGSTAYSINVGAGTYSVTFSNYGCTSTATATVTAGSATANISGNLNVCNGQTTTLTASGGGTYTWSNGSSNPSINVGAGTYTVTVTNGSCTATKTVTVTSGTVIATITGNLNVCNGQTTTLTATGGGTYSWSNGSTNPSINVGAGTYTVTVTNGSCTATATATVTSGSATANISGNLSVCNGQTTTLTASGGGTYYWSNGSTNSSINVGAGTYTVTVTNGSCTATKTVTVTTTATTVTLTSCPQNIVLTATTGNCATATWTAPTATSNCGNPSVSSNYNSGFCFPFGTTTVTYVATLNGVSKTCSFTVTVNPPACNLAINISNKTCNNNGTPSNPNDDTYSFSLTVTGGTGSWSGSFSNSYLGLFQIPATPYGTAIQLGPFPAGSVTSTNTNPPITIPSVDISISVRDVQNANCTKSTVVTSTGTCSTAPLLGSIGDLAYCDNNNNSVFDNGDTPQSGVQIQLCNASNTVIATATTDAQGKYLFPNLTAGIYIVKFPATITGGKTITTQSPITVNLTAGQNYLDADGGYYKPATCPDGTPKKVVGSACNDNNPNTTNDKIQADGCGCAGTPVNNNDFCTNPDANVTTSTGSITISGITTSAAIIQIFNGSWASVFNQTTTTSTVVIPNLPNGTYYVKVTVLGTGGSWPAQCEKMVTVTISGGGNNLCPDGSPKKTPGTACNDNNPNTTNDVIQADGCGCAGTPVVPTCPDGTPKKTPGTACNDNNPNTTNDVIQADGCGCAGTPVVPTCPDGTPKKTPGTACNDNNPNTTNDVIQADGCGCAGTPSGGSDFCTNPTANVTTSAGTITISGITTSSAIVQVFNGSWVSVFNQTTTTSTVVIPNLPNGTYYVKVTVLGTGGTWPAKCEKMVTVTVSGGGNNTCADGTPKKTPGTACNDNNPNTTNDVIQADGCGCAGTPVAPNCNETRNNTITKSCVSGKPVLTGTALAGYEYMWLSSTSACPNDPNQAIAGATSQNLYLTANVTQTTYFSRCARPIGCTTWGAITESNCLTVTPADCGTTTGGCDALSVVGNSNGTISIAGMGSYTSQVIIFNSQWQPVFNQQYNTATATIPLKNGGYIVKIQLYNTNGTWQFVCEKMFQNITVTGGVASLASGRLVLDLTAAAELHKVKLVWANNTGYKNDYFEVEKLNEKSSIFEKIAIINSHNGDKMESYTAFDEQPTEGDNIYRINLIGTDGTTKVSNQSVVKFNKAYDFRIFPNPVSDYIDVDLKQYEGKTVTLQVYNSFGKVIATQQVERASSLPVHLDLNPIVAGQYLIRVTSEGRKAAVKKFVIQN